MAKVTVRLYQSAQDTLPIRGKTFDEIEADPVLNAAFQEARARDWQATWEGAFQGDEHYGQDFTYEAQGEGEEILNRAYHLFNVGDDPTFGTPDPIAVEYRRGKRRSLSIGDVVEVDGQAWICQRGGWTKV